MAEQETVRLDLPYRIDAVQAARRLVTDALHRWRLEHLADTSALLLSELATNAVVHTTGPFTVSVARDAEWLRIGVEDNSPVMPLLRRYARDATTGRGLQLVAMLSADQGVERLPEGGKVVWFELAVAGGDPLAEGGADGQGDVDLDDIDLDAWAAMGDWPDEAAGAAAAASPPPGSPLFHVDIIGVPLHLSTRSREHFDGLVRDLVLLGEAEDAVGRRLTRLRDELLLRFGAFTTSQRLAMEAAEARGDRSIDVSYDLPAEAAAAALQLDTLLDEADEFCRRGDLLMLATPPDALAYRKWYLGEIVRQVNGQPATPWSDALVCGGTA